MVRATEGVLEDLATRFQPGDESAAASKDMAEVSKLLNSVYQIRELVWSRDHIMHLQRKLADFMLETPLFAFRITLCELLQ